VPADRPISVAIGDATLLVDVRSGPLCGLKSDISRGPRSAIIGCERSQQNNPYSITSSARARSIGGASRPILAGIGVDSLCCVHVHRE
jgi:hypothetical protein